ncbi:MAG: retropepsin-like aspartic protease, partial [Bacteroidetes bacterium]|nr:retropepsin-like aspartic protease [Bacteroidota bacterium]
MIEKNIEYDILKSYIEIKNQTVETVIDTCANTSIISKEFALKLKLIIGVNEKSNVTVVDNNTIKTYGTVKDLPIRIENKIFKCHAIVLNEPAQHLLLENNFLIKHRCNISLKDMIMSIILCSTGDWIH